MKHIKVFAPGTVANLGCGFDIMGLTLDGVGDRIEVAAEAGASGLAIRNESGKRLPEKPEDNVITPAVAALLEAYGKPVRVEITILEKIAPGSGIGSSAASSAAAVYGLNELLGRPFSAERLVEFAMMGEALIGGTPHADNVGPALLGGVVLIRGYGPLDIIRLPVPDDFFYAVAHPDIVVGTKEAREVLPREIPMAHRRTCRRTGAGRRGADRPLDARRRRGALPQGIHSRLRPFEGGGALRRRSGHEHRRIGTFGLCAGRRRVGVGTGR